MCVLIRLDHIGNVLEFSDYDGFDIWRSLKNQPTDDDYKGIIFFNYYILVIKTSPLTMIIKVPSTTHIKNTLATH